MGSTEACTVLRRAGFRAPHSSRARSSHANSTWPRPRLGLAAGHRRPAARCCSLQWNEHVLRLFVKTTLSHQGAFISPKPQDVAMADDEKARLYKQLVQQVPEHILLEELRLHGFWHNQDIPTDPPDEAAERAQLDAEIAQLQKTQSKAQNPQQALAQERKRRWG